MPTGDGRERGYAPAPAAKRVRNGGRLWGRDGRPPIPPLIEFEGAGVELIIGALELEQIVVRAALDDAAVV